MTESDPRRRCRVSALQHRSKDQPHRPKADLLKVSFGSVCDIVIWPQSRHPKKGVARKHVDSRPDFLRKQPHRRAALTMALATGTLPVKQHAPVFAGKFSCGTSVGTREPRILGVPPGRARFREYRRRTRPSLQLPVPTWRPQTEARLQGGCQSGTVRRAPSPGRGGSRLVSERKTATIRTPQAAEVFWGPFLCALAKSVPRVMPRKRN